MSKKRINEFKEWRDNVKANILPKDNIWVFGSGDWDIDEKATGVYARQCGADLSVKEGLSGQAYAIPIEQWDGNLLPLSKIKEGIERFNSFAKENKQFTYLVTELGCGGLRGFFGKYQPKDIAPLFVSVREEKHILLPERFVEVLETINN